MPLTDLRHTIGTGDLFHKQTSICRATMIAVLYNIIPPFAGELILQPWAVRKFLVFLCLNLLKKYFQITMFNRLLLV